MGIKILISDDHAIFRSGLRAYLEKIEDFVVEAESGNGFETLDILRNRKIDVLLLDISMPGIPSLKVAEEALKINPNIAIVVLTMHEDEYYLKEFLKIGIKSYILKKSPPSELVHAIKAAHSGKHYIDPAFSQFMVSYMIEKPKKSRRKKAVLTTREEEVLKLLAMGYTNEEVARKLFISKRTVETHRANIMQKLNFKTRAELVRYALENGLLKL